MEREVINSRKKVVKITTPIFDGVCRSQILI